MLIVLQIFTSTVGLILFRPCPLLLAAFRALCAVDITTLQGCGGGRVSQAKQIMYVSFYTPY